MTEDLLCVKKNVTVKRHYCEQECPRRKVRGGDCGAWERLEGRGIAKRREKQ